MKGEAETQVRNPDHIGQDRSLLILLWSIILAKCFGSEFLVRTYEVPINSALYIWTPTFIFAVVASIVYVTLVQEESGKALPSRKHILLWSSVAVIALVTVTLGLLGPIDGYLLPAVLSVILGAGFFFLGAVSPYAPLFRAAGGGWWISAGAQFIAADVRTLLLFSISLLAFAAVPVAIVMFRRRKR